MTFRMTFEAEAAPCIWCFEKLGSYVYTGTGPQGKVIRSYDLSTWTDFAETGDAHVRSLKAWANALFMGTEPNGQIHVYNFTSGSFYKIVQTEDHAVTCFTEHDGKLYAGTSPRGVIYVFDGILWQKSFKPGGGGVNSMVSSGGVLYAFLDNTEMPVRFVGGTWSAVADSDPQSVTFSSFASSGNRFTTDGYGEVDLTQVEDVKSAVEVGELSEADTPFMSPSLPETSLGSSAVDSVEGIIVGGKLHGSVFSYQSPVLSKIFQSDAGGITAIANIGSSRNLVAAGDTLYLVAGEGE